MNRLPAQNLLEFDLPALDLTASFLADESKPAAGGEKYVTFTQGAEFYAISSVMVTEVVASLIVAPLPKAPEWLHGIANLRGEIIAVLNLPLLFGIYDAASAPKSKFVVLRSPAFEFGAAFAADRLNEIVTLADEQIQRLENENSPFIFGRAAFQSNTLNLIDAKKLLASLVV